MLTGVLKAVNVVFGFFGKLTTYFNNKMLMKAGEDKAKGEINAQAIEDIQKANAAIDSLRDPTIRDRLRKRFTRSDQ